MTYKHNDFTFGKEVGRGGFAKVFKATHKSTGIDYAIKLINKVEMIKKRFESRVKSEITIQLQMEHPNILQLHDVFEDESFVYLVLDYCPNGDLSKYMKNNGKLSEYQARNFMDQLVSGLLYLHKCHVIHRDLKLANLLLDEHYNVKIADFGLATVLQNVEDMHHTMCGTPNYMARETVSGDGHGLESDVWSLGCLLYTFLVGNPPFDTNVVRSTLKRVVIGDYVIPEHVSNTATDLIKKLLMKNPHERITLEEIIDHPFMKSSSYVERSTSLDSGNQTLSSGNSSRTPSYKPVLHGNFLDNLLTESRQVELNDANEVSGSRSSWFQKTKSRVCCDQLPARPNIQTSQKSLEEDQMISSISQNLSNLFNQNSKQLTKSRRRYSQSPQRFVGDEKEKSFITSAHSLSHSDDEHSMPQTKNVLNKRNRRYSHKFESTKNLRTYTKQEQNTPSFEVKTNKRLIDEMLIDTSRLLPARHRNKNTILTILKNGWACLEIIKSSNQLESVYEVLLVSKDGNFIKTFRPSKNTLIKDSPIETPHSALEFQKDCLPEKYFNHYKLLYKYVEIVRSQTAKITIYTGQAKCILMENLITFEIYFYNGVKLSSSKGKTELSDGNETVTSQLDLLDFYNDAFVPKRYSIFVDIGRKVREEVLELNEKYEKITEHFNSLGSVFPLRIGRLPSNMKTNFLQQKSSNVSNEKIVVTQQSPQPTQVSIKVSESLMSFKSQQENKKTKECEPSVVNPTMDRSALSKIDEDLVQDTSCIVRKIKVGNSKVHYLKQGSKDMLWVKYQDNSQILIDGCNIFPVKYKFSDGETNAYDKFVKLPPIVKETLSGLENLIAKTRFHHVP